MNKWTKKSINLANSQGYLDRLFNVYPIELGVSRSLPEEIKEEIKQAFENKDKVAFIKELLKLSKFPLDDPYIASLRKHPHLLERNPETIDRIAKKLFSMGIEVILKLAERPKSPSRQLGHSFKKWLKILDYPFVGERDFKDHKSVAFLDGSDTKLKEFAIKEIGVKKLKKGVDFIIKLGGRFVIGEAKFLTGHGGTQNNQFNDAINVARIKKDNVMGVAVLDGIVWFESNTHIHRTIKSFNGVALSALLLKEFIEEQSEKHKNRAHG